MKAVLIAGPTASGKSALALEFAARLDGVVVNADSMQVYDTLRVLTARPTEADLDRANHHLYGHVPAQQAYSVGRWTRDVEMLLADQKLQGKIPIFVGGTGLYFKALLGGLSSMPVIPETVRRLWRERLTSQGSAILHEELERRDPETASRLKVGDGQRIVRALEVFDATGRPISAFQENKGKALIDVGAARKIVFRPDRQVLRHRIRARFEAMINTGAIEEVRTLLSLNIGPDVPAMKAIGVREISAFLEGRSSMDEAVELASIATRQYAKRQMTWFRNQFSDNWESR